MNEYGLVDLSNSQWIGRRLREYTVKQVIDIVAQMPKVDEQYQYHCNLMVICNNYLERELSNFEKSPAWEPIIKKVPYYRNALLALSQSSLGEIVQAYGGYTNERYSKSLPIDVNHKFKFLETYRALNENIKEEDAVRCVLRNMEISCSEWYKSYVLPPNHNGANAIISDSIKSYFSFNLFSCDIIKERKDEVAIFLIDSCNAAKTLQDQYSHQYIDFIKTTQIDFWKKIYDVKMAQPQYGTPPKSTVMEEINALSIEPLTMTRTCTNVIWSSWFGGYELLNHVKWSVLDGHNVYLFQVNVEKKIALEHFVKVCQALNRPAPDNISLVWLERKADPINMENNPFKMFSYCEALEEASNSGIEMDDRQASKLAQYLRDQGRAPRHTGRYLIDPIIRQNSFIVLSGLEGSGKSWLAMGLGAAMATKGQLFHDWDACKKAKVVYLTDDEMDDDLLDDRRIVLRKLYRTYADNFVFESVHRIDLTDEATRTAIEGRLDQLWLKMNNSLPSVLILDHLNKLTDNKGNSKEHWPIIRKWIEDLNKKKITVILVHHEYVAGKMTGTVLIPQDANIHIHVEHGKADLAKHEIEIVYSIDKNKGAKDQRKPRSVILDISKGKWYTPDAPIVTHDTNWNSLSEEKRVHEIKMMLETKTIREIAEFFERSKSFIEKFCQKHDISKRRHLKQISKGLNSDT